MRLKRESHLRSLRALAWRAVEAQHVIATRRLVSSVEEHEILEQMIEDHKPPSPKGDEFSGLHYLLATPFRYPPLRHGSRFGTRAERSIWYGAEELRGAFAEVAYYRLLFLEGTTADLEPIALELTAFQAAVRTARGADLTREPHGSRRAVLSSPTDYRASQRLGRQMREDGVEAFRYFSARDRSGGVNVGVFSPRAFAARRPARLQNWYCLTSRSGVELSRKDFFKKERFVFPRSDFAIRGRLPRPAL